MDDSRIISDFAMAIEASPTMAMASLARQMRKEGKDVLSFAIGEPDFATPDNICDAAKRAIDEGQTKYTPASGTPEVKAAVVAAAERDLGLTYEPDQVAVSNGGKHALMNIWRTLLNPGDEVIMFAPYWVSYPDQVKMAGGAPVVIETFGADDFEPDLDEVKARVTSKTAAILINSPSNPTGGVYSRETIEGIAAIAQSNDVMIVSDEIYKHILFDGREHISPAQLDDDLKQRTIMCDGVSKTYAMTGWRIGWLIGPAGFAKKAGNIQSQETSCPCAISQAAAIEALTGPQDSVEPMRAAFQQRRDYVVPALNAIPGVECPNPGGAFYVFPDVREYIGRTLNGVEITNSQDFCMYLLEQALVSTVAGSASGSEGCFRISFACSMEEITEGVRRIAEALK